MTDYDDRLGVAFLVAVVVAVVAIALSLWLLSELLDDIYPPPVTLPPLTTAE